MEVLWYRTGFFYLRGRPQFTLHGEPEGHDPFRKVYLYGDEGSAAEDAVFLFFRVWEMPVGSRLYVTSAVSTCGSGAPRSDNINASRATEAALPL